MTHLATVSTIGGRQVDRRCITELESLSTNAECRAEWWLGNPFNCARVVLPGCIARDFPLNLADDEVRRGGERLNART
jgi:hypothetical protein